MAWPYPPYWEAFAELMGQNLSPKERMASTCQGAITGLGDDFFDKNKFSENQLKDFLENPQHFKANNAANELFLNFYTQSLSLSADRSATLKRLKAVYQAQLQSMAQKIGYSTPVVY
jgi:Glu-tRNA(Gln) amidotransferase subunit E-like FAD-binding protein